MPNLCDCVCLWKSLFDARLLLLVLLCSCCYVLIAYLPFILSFYNSIVCYSGVVVSTPEHVIYELVS